MLKLVGSNQHVFISNCHYSMADVKTEGLKSVDNITSTNPTVNARTDKMTVEKRVCQSPVTKNKSTVKEGSDEAPLATPAQLKVAPGNNAPPSPKKSDSKNSPTLKSSSGVQPKTPVQQQQQQQAGKVKVNPWHKNSPAPSSGGTVKKPPAPEGADIGTTSSGSSSPKEDSSKNIQIPKDGVSCIM